MTNQQIIEQLRRYAMELRRRSIPLSDIIPLMLEAADRLEAIQ